MASQQSYRFLSRLGRSASLLKKTCSRSSHLSAALLTRVSHPHFPAVSLVSTKRYLSSSGETFSLINIQDVEDFQKRVKESTVPVVVDFHATWCGPCKLLGPRLESIVAGKEGKVVLAKIDIDDNTDLAMEYDVQAVPTVFSFKNGKKVDQFTGLQDDDKIKSFVEKLIH